MFNPPGFTYPPCFLCQKNVQYIEPCQIHPSQVAFLVTGDSLSERAAAEQSLQAAPLRVQIPEYRL